VIRIDTIWLATEPIDMRASTEKALARLIAVFGAAKPHCAYLFANRRANRMKVLVTQCVDATDQLVELEDCLSCRIQSSISAQLVDQRAQGYFL